MSKWLHRDSGKAVRRWWRGHSLASRDEAETGKLRPDPRGGREPPRGKLVGRGRACLAVDFQTVGKSSPGTNSARCSSPGKRRGCPRGFAVPNEPLRSVRLAGWAEPRWPAHSQKHYSRPDRIVFFSHNNQSEQYFSVLPNRPKMGEVWVLVPCHLQ